MKGDHMPNKNSGRLSIGDGAEKNGASTLSNQNNENNRVCNT